MYPCQFQALDAEGCHENNRVHRPFITNKNLFSHVHFPIVSGLKLKESFALHKGSDCTTLRDLYSTIYPTLLFMLQLSADPAL